jgi:hypothetical protein
MSALVRVQDGWDNDEHNILNLEDSNDVDCASIFFFVDNVYHGKVAAGAGSGVCSRQ